MVFKKKTVKEDAATSVDPVAELNAAFDKFELELKNLKAEQKKDNGALEAMLGGFKTNLGDRIGLIEKQLEGVVVQVKKLSKVKAVVQTARPTAEVPIQGDPHRWEMLCVSGTNERTLRTEAYEVLGLGVVVRCADGNEQSLTFVPGAKLAGTPGDRRIEKMP